MFVEALQLLLKRCAAATGGGGVCVGGGRRLLERTACIGVSGQQHGSVYWSKQAPALLQRLSTAANARPLHAQLKNAFTGRRPCYMER
jgi:sugar (pentulose or hexulose) kinase